MHRFLSWTVASSAAWAALLIGMLLGPLTGGSPLLSLIAGVSMAVLTALAFSLVQRVHARRTATAERRRHTDVELVTAADRRADCPYA